MSKGNKEEQKWLLGESLNQYDRSLKEELGKVEKRNREQNHKISALINAFDDDYIKKEEENTNISLDYSKEGIVIVDDIKGNTLVNNVKDSNKELVLNGDIDTQGINVTLENTVNNGKVDVILEGNTEVNLSKTKDPIMITHKFDDINSNDGKLQTTVNEVTTVNDSPGKVDVKEITGDTLVNHVSNGSEELILNGNIETNGYSNITLTEGIDGGKVDVSLEGNTMVNVCDQEEPVAITKSYTVETGNHIALQGEYDGKCRPNIYGNTLVNLIDLKTPTLERPVESTNIYNITNKNGYIKVTTNSTIKETWLYVGFPGLKSSMFKPSTTYTVCFNKLKGVAYLNLVNGNGTNNFIANNIITTDNKLMYTFTTKTTLTATFQILYFGVSQANPLDIEIENPIILEGDYTNKPIPDYFTGMKSSFEDKLVSENLYKFSSRDDFYSLDGGTTLDGEYIKMTANSGYQNAMLKPLDTIKPSTTYTIVVDVVENTLNSKLVITAPVKKKDVQLFTTQTFQIDAGKTGIFTQMATTNNDLSGCVRCLVNYLQNTNTTGSIKYRIMVVEGDYTNYDFTDYDSTKAGKYKVDYKVTGKNKFNKDSSIINTVIDINNGSIITENKTEGQWYTSPTIDISNISNITISHKNDGYINASTGIRYLLMDENYNPKLYADCTYINYAQTLDVSKYKYMKISVLTRLFPLNTIQIEEGATATDYEPYKESIKTLYLNSPLLEGDTIEQSGNNIIHNHRYTSITNKDLIPTFISLDNNNYRTDTSCACLFNFKDKTYNKPKTIMYCDKLPYYANSWSTTSVDCAICGVNNDYDFSIRLPHSVTGITTQDTGSECMEKFKTWNDNNLINIVYELATPTQEIISSNDNLLLDSYTNGHLDVDTVVPINKVEFKGNFNTSLKYLYPNTEYTIQFESDNIGKIDRLHLGGTNSDTLNVTKGINKYTITTGELSSKSIIINGIGFNASKIVVTPKVDNDFRYFKGMKSVGECEGNKIEILSRNKNLITGIKNGVVDNYGKENNHATTIIPIDYISVKNGETYYFSSNFSGYKVVHEYDKDKNFIKYHAIGVSNNYCTLSSNCKYIKFRYEPSNGETLLNTQLQFEKGAVGTPYVEGKSNKKEILMNEPLRGLPNGVKDKYVIIDGKWYIERNTVQIDLSTIPLNDWKTWTDNNTEYWSFYAYHKLLKYQVNEQEINVYCNTRIGVTNMDRIRSQTGIGVHIGCGMVERGGYIAIGFKRTELSSIDTTGLKQWLINNPTKIIAEAQPTYEPIDYNPFEVYTDITHISNNSIIPCNMVIKNSGYNTISLKENTKYTAYVNNKNNVSLTYKMDNNAIAVNSSNKFTFTTPSTLVDKTIRIASKGNKIENLMIIEGTPQNDPIGYFDGLKSSYECEKVTDVNDENFGKYKVDTKVKGENFESTQTVYLNSPLLKGDKIIWKDNKLQHYHKMKTVVFDGSDDEIWQRQQNLDTKNTERYFISDNTVKPNSSLISDVLPTEKLGIDDLTYLYVHNIEKRFDIKKLKTDTRWNDVTTLKKYLQQNPITVVYELATPYYEEISEYPLKFSSIANCSLSTTSNIQVSNISFNIYEETLPYLYNDKKYYITFNSDISKEIIINLGGSELIYTTKVGFNKVEITTPSNSNNMLTFNGQGVNINNVKVTQQNIDSYFEGMKSVGECEDLEIVSNNNDNTLSNKQTMTHEPLRGLPNGVRDKYVIIDGKWYIERNTIQLRMDSQFIQNKKIFTYVSQNYPDVIGFSTPNNWFKWNSSLVCDNLVYDGHRNISAGSLISNQEKIFVYDYIFITLNKNKVSTLNEAGFREYLKNNPTKIIAEAQPTYEPIDYNPFEVYTDTTYISNNSTIPCNMVIKNTGYNCILKPNTKYTVVTNTQGSISAKIGSTKVNSTSNVFTIITPSTLTDSVLRLSGKGLTTKDIMLLEGDKTNYIPKYFTGMESAFEQEYDEEKNKYKVNVKVTDGNKENDITFYINEPLRGVGNIKDKVYVKENKVVVERNCYELKINRNCAISLGNNYDNYNTFMFRLYFHRFNNNFPNASQQFVHCNTISWSTNNIWTTDKENVVVGDLQTQILDFRINKNKLSSLDVEGFYKWLENNPTTVVYQLATPTYEEVECDLSKLMLENYENSSLILNSNIPPTVDVRYKGEVPIVSATKELSSNVESTTTDINENIIPYMCDMDYRIVELQLKNASTQGLEVNVLGLDSEDVLFNNRKANKIFNPSYEMLKRDILSKRYSTDEYKYRLERYLLANKISNEEYNELEELTVKNKL